MKPGTQILRPVTALILALVLMIPSVVNVGAQQRPEVTIREIIRDPAQYVGEEVTVTGTPAHVITNFAFTVSKGGEDILVLAPPEIVPEVLQLGIATIDQATVTGTVLVGLNIRDIERELTVRPTRRERAALDEFEDLPFILADEVQVSKKQFERTVNPDDIDVLEGFRVEPFVTGLTYATDIAFSDDGEIFVSEAGGHTYGTTPAEAPPPRILRVTETGETEVVYEQQLSLREIREAETCEEIPEGLIAPITGITWHEGLLYISHRSRVSVLDVGTGEFETIIECLPAWGEFQNNKPIFGPDGLMYFFVSTQGNSGPVGADMMTVLKSYDLPEQHEVPCEDVVLTGKDFFVDNKFSPEPNDFERTGVYVPFGHRTVPGQVIEGEVKCNGAFLRANPDGTDLEVVAWGLRSNFGYRFSPDGRLISTMNSGNPIDPRPIFDDWETIWEIDPGAWYGWPDYYSGLPVTLERFALPDDPDFTGAPHPHEFVLTEETHQRLLDDEPLPPQPLVRIKPHVATEGMVFGREAFGMDEEHEILVAEMGTVVPYLRDEAPGFRVQKVNLDTGQISDFLVNVSGRPASATSGGGLERPIQLEWGPDGALYVVDFGVIELTAGGLEAFTDTGVIWRVEAEEGAFATQADEEDVAAAADAAGRVELGELVETPDEFVGQDVTVTGDVGEELEREAFTLEIDGEQVLVVGDRNAIPSQLGDQALVAGEFREGFDIRDIEQELGVQLNERVLREFEGERFILAEDVRAATVPELGQEETFGNEARAAGLFRGVERFCRETEDVFGGSEFGFFGGGEDESLDEPFLIAEEVERFCRGFEEDFTAEDFGVTGVRDREARRAETGAALERPERLIGETVTIIRPVVEMVTETAFVVTSGGQDSARLLVVGSPDIVPESLTRGALVRARGAVEEFELAVIEEDVGVDLDDEAFEAFEGQPVLVAGAIDRIATVAEILTETREFLGHRAIVDGPVERVFGQGVFTIGADTGDDQLLVVDPEGVFPEDLAEGDIAEARGVVREFDPRLIERLGLEVDAEALSEFEGEPVLVAEPEAEE